MKKKRLIFALTIIMALSIFSNIFAQDLSEEKDSQLNEINNAEADLNTTDEVGTYNTIESQYNSSLGKMTKSRDGYVYYNKIIFTPLKSQNNNYLDIQVVGDKYAPDALNVKALVNVFGSRSNFTDIFDLNKQSHLNYGFNNFNLTIAYYNKQGSYLNKNFKMKVVRKSTHMYELSSNVTLKDLDIMEESVIVMSYAGLIKIGSGTLDSERQIILFQENENRNVGVYKLEKEQPNLTFLEEPKVNINENAMTNDIRLNASVKYQMTKKEGISSRSLKIYEANSNKLVKEIDLGRDDIIYDESVRTMSLEDYTLPKGTLDHNNTYRASFEVVYDDQSKSESVKSLGFTTNPLIVVKNIEEKNGTKMTYTFKDYDGENHLTKLNLNFNLISKRKFESQELNGQVLDISIPELNYDERVENIELQLLGMENDHYVYGINKKIVSNLINPNGKNVFSEAGKDYNIDLKFADKSTKEFRIKTDKRVWIKYVSEKTKIDMDSIHPDYYVQGFEYIDFVNLTEFKIENFVKEKFFKFINLYYIKNLEEGLLEGKIIHLGNDDDAPEGNLNLDKNNEYFLYHYEPEDIVSNNLKPLVFEIDEIKPYYNSGKLESMTENLMIFSEKYKNNYRFDISLKEIKNTKKQVYKGFKFDLAFDKGEYINDTFVPNGEQINISLENDRKTVLDIDFKNTSGTSAISLLPQNSFVSHDRMKYKNEMLNPGDEYTGKIIWSISSEVLVMD